MGRPDDATVTGYRIDRRSAANPSDQQRSAGGPRDNHTLVEDTGSPDTSYTDQSAEKGVEYEYRVSARNEAGAGEVSDWVRAGPEPVLGDGPPGAPGNLTVAAGDRELTLSWDPPADNGNAPATRYRIEWRIDGKDYGRSQWGTSGKTTYTKTDLANGVKYVFRVKAENGTGNYGPYGPASEEVSATPTSGSAVDLGTPVLSSTKTLHHGMVKLDWEDIEDAGWYVAQYYHVKGGEWLDLPAEGVDIAFHGSSAVVSNLHGLSWLRVRAMSCAGESEWSQIEQLFGTNASDWEGVPVPEVAEGDEIEPCDEDPDTPDNSPATGAPTISGTAQVGETLTANTSGIADADGLANATFSYQWITDDSVIVASAARTYTPTDGDRGKSVKVRVSFTDDAGNDETLSSAATDAVAATLLPPPNNVRAVKEEGGIRLTWEAPGDTTVTGYRIDRRRSGADRSDQQRAAGRPRDNHTLVEDTGSADTGYTDKSAEKGVEYEYRVSARNEAGAGAGSDWVRAGPEPVSNNPATGLPSIGGTAQVGGTLTADTSDIADEDGLSGATFSYQWVTNDGNSDSDITGATDFTYIPVAADEGKTIKVRVSFTDDAGNEEALTSAATTAVAGAVPDQVDSGSPSYITVEVTEDTSDPINIVTNFTIT